MKRICLLTCMVALASFATIGCKPTNTAKAPVTPDAHDHDHGHDHGHDHKHVETLPAFLTELTEAYTAIKTAMEKNDSEAAHGPLHTVADLLDLEKGDIAGLLKKSSLDDDTKGKIKTALTKIFDEFYKLDNQFHGGPKVEWADLDKNIVPAMEELKGLIK
ncbi:MAG: hypothetical protein U0930_08510 [Pirellulales bacterium]